MRLALQETEISELTSEVAAHKMRLSEKKLENIATTCSLPVHVLPVHVSLQEMEHDRITEERTCAMTELKKEQLKHDILAVALQSKDQALLAATQRIRVLEDSLSVMEKMDTSMEHDKEPPTALRPAPSYSADVYQQDTPLGWEQHVAALDARLVTANEENEKMRVLVSALQEEIARLEIQQMAPVNRNQEAVYSPEPGLMGSPRKEGVVSAAVWQRRTQKLDVLKLRALEQERYCDVTDPFTMTYCDVTSSSTVYTLCYTMCALEAIPCVH